MVGPSRGRGCSSLDSLSLCAGVERPIWCLHAIGDPGNRSPGTLRRMQNSPTQASEPQRLRPVDRVGDIIRIAAGGVTAVAVLVTIVSALVLLRRFRPDLQVDDWSAADAAVRRYAPSGWVSAHEIALNVAVVGSPVWAVTTAVFVRARSRAATALMLAATAVVVIGCVVASSTWGLVRWDQLALWSVMSGDLFADGGLWEPAVSDDVRFLIVGGAEVGQGTYRRTLLVHLAAPVVALCALGVSFLLGRTRGTHRGLTNSLGRRRRCGHP